MACRGIALLGSQVYMVKKGTRTVAYNMFLTDKKS